MIDVVTVGAGGGSIAWLSPEGTLKVGPASAGADPGPLCYAKGGADVTITDAHVVLGRIPPHLLGGEIPLEVEAARRGLADLGAKLGMTPEQCATACWRSRPGTRPTRCARSPSSAGWTCATSR
jgi:N-methylhydantoinase A